jgi:uncharacterized protein (TIGR02246 family)
MIARISHSVFAVIASLLSLALFVVTGAAQSPNEQVARNLPQAFCQAWNHHDGHALAQIMSEDADFVSVGAVWFHGRADFEKYHSRLLSGRFAESTSTPPETRVRFLRPDVALIHWSWRIEGDKNFDGSPRPKRFGLMTMLAEKRGDAWLVVAARNTIRWREPLQKKSA